MSKIKFLFITVRRTMFYSSKRIVSLLIAVLCCTNIKVEAKDMKCIYILKEAEASPFSPSIIEMVHDAVRLKFEEIAQSDHLFETLDVQHSIESDGNIEFIYHVLIDDSIIGIEAKLESIFKGLKEDIVYTNLDELVQLVQDQLLKKIKSFDACIQEKVMDQLVAYRKSFNAEQFLSNVQRLEFSVCEEKQLHSLLWREFEFDHFENYRMMQINDDSRVYELSLSHREKEIIHHIISEMGSKSLFTLLRKRSEMLKCGDQIRNVPPMDFLGYIFSQPDLRKQMHSIKKSHFKWKNIVDEIGTNMSKESKHESFHDKIESFSRFLQIDPQVLLQKAEKKDWSGFVSALM